MLAPAMAGIAGGFYVMYVTFVEPPQVFDLGFNVEIVMASPIIGLQRLYPNVPYQKLCHYRSPTSSFRYQHT